MKTYLERIQENLFEKKYEIFNKLTDLKNEYKENLEMLRLLDESSDKIIESFTPRTINSFSKDKIVELKLRQKELENEITDTEEEIRGIGLDIEEINEIIKKYNSFNKGLSLIYEKIQECSGMLNKDTMECKKIMMSIENIIEEIIE